MQKNALEGYGTGQMRDARLGDVMEPRGVLEVRILGYNCGVTINTRHHLYV